MIELEKTARELILALTEKTLKALHKQGLLKEPSKLQMLCSSPKITSLIKKLSAPKYDPNRLFRENDEVRVIEKDGRTVYDPLNGGIWRVARNERTGGAHEMSVLVHLIYEGETTHQISVPFCFLELVTPVEELEPFSIYKSDDNEYVILFDDTRVSTFPFKGEGYPYYYTQEQAKARAEQERDRLNAEWRKELNND